jgi:mannose-1-phosphate guanylyltransferase
MTAPMDSSFWPIVLAAGSGRRLARVTRGVPKQFWAPPGQPSLLEQTLARVAPLAEPHQTVTIVDQSHRPYLTNIERRTSLGRLVYQPEDRGTAAGVLLPAMLVAIHDPDAVVLVTPSDHGVRCADDFRAGVAASKAYVASHPDVVVLHGVEPQTAAVDLGWIMPAAPCRRTPAPVARFIEKPAVSVAEKLFGEGAVWNTMVLVARVGTLLHLYRRYLPDLIAPFESLRFMAPEERQAAVSRMYRHLPVADFSRDLLACATNLQVLAWGASMGWTDLGTPDRLAGWLGRPGSNEALDRRAPVFPHQPAAGAVAS